MMNTLEKTIGFITIALILSLIINLKPATTGYITSSNPADNIIQSHKPPMRINLLKYSLPLQILIIIAAFIVFFAKYKKHKYQWV